MAKFGHDPVAPFNEILHRIGGMLWATASQATAEGGLPLEATLSAIEPSLKKAGVEEIASDCWMLSQIRFAHGAELSALPRAVDCRHDSRRQLPDARYDEARAVNSILAQNLPFIRRGYPDSVVFAKEPGKTLFHGALTELQLAEYSRAFRDTVSSKHKWLAFDDPHAFAVMHPVFDAFVHSGTMALARLYDDSSGRNRNRSLAGIVDVIEGTTDLAVHRLDRWTVETLRTLGADRRTLDRITRDGTTLPPKKLKGAIAQGLKQALTQDALAAAVARLKAVRDKRFAHNDRGEATQQPTFADIELLLDRAHQITNFIQVHFVSDKARLIRNGHYFIRLRAEEYRRKVNFLFWRLNPRSPRPLRCFLLDEWIPAQM